MKKARLALVEALKRSMLPEPEPDMRDWNWQRFLNWQTHKHGLGALIDGSYRGRRSPQEIATEERTNREYEQQCAEYDKAAAAQKAAAAAAAPTTDVSARPLLTPGDLGMATPPPLPSPDIAEGTIDREAVLKESPHAFWFEDYVHWRPPAQRESYDRDGNFCLTEYDPFAEFEDDD